MRLLLLGVTGRETAINKRNQCDWVVARASPVVREVLDAGQKQKSRLEADDQRTGCNSCSITRPEAEKIGDIKLMPAKAICCTPPHADSAPRKMPECGLEPSVGASFLACTCENIRYDYVVELTLWTVECVVKTLGSCCIERKLYLKCQHVEV